MRLSTALRLAAFPLVGLLVVASVGPPGAAGQTPSAQDTPEAIGSLRPRPTPRPFDNPAAAPTDDGVRSDRPLETPGADSAVRTDDPVLRWLPEILAASAATGTPPSLIAGIMRVESGGDPESVSVDGAQGLMQVMPSELAALGIPQTRWRDPTTNVLAGATILAQRSGGGWEAAVAYYFGIGCDAYGTCTYGYVVAVLGWTAAYAAVLGDPIVLSVGNIPSVPTGPAPPGRGSSGQDGSDSTSSPKQPASDTGQGWGGEEATSEPANPPEQAPSSGPKEEQPAPQPTADSDTWGVDG